MQTVKVMTVEMPDGSTWAVPVDAIARNRATYYAKEFDGDVERSLAEDTGPLFATDDYEIEDWAVNNMDWKDVEGVAFELPVAKTRDQYQDGWMEGEKEITEVTRGESK